MVVCSLTSPGALQAACQKLLKAELSGSMLTVRRSKCPSYVGLRGIVMQESRHTFTLITPQDSVKCKEEREREGEKESVCVGDGFLSMRMCAYMRMCLHMCVYIQVCGVCVRVCVGGEGREREREREIDKLLEAELSGSMLTVRRSKCPSYVGLRGIVMQESRHTFTLITPQDSVKCKEERERERARKRVYV